MQNIAKNLTENEIEGLLNLHKQSLEESEGRERDLQEKLQQLQTQQELKEKQADILERFNTQVGSKNFVHEFVKQRVHKSFAEEREKTENKSLSDEKLFEKLTKDKDFFKPEKSVDMGIIRGKLNDDESIRKIMGLN